MEGAKPDLYLADKLKKYAGSGILPMHMPGHKRNTAEFQWLSGLSCRMDITEIDGFDNLNEPEGIFAELNELAAETWGADHSICMVNGSTGAILAAVRTAMAHGGELLIFRGCHKSVYNAAELCGARMNYLIPEMDKKTQIWGSIAPESVNDALQNNPDIRLVVITSPTYEGVISDIEKIAEVCHGHNVPLLVDEAHGAHLGFGSFPKSAVRCGADMVVQSLHKTLPSLTQTAVLHINNGLISYSEAQRNAAIFQSSSPSYLLSSSIDGCVRYMAQKGHLRAEEWLDALKQVDETAARLKKLKILCRGTDTAEEHGFYNIDPSKIVIMTSDSNIQGAELAAILREEYGIEPEMVSGDYVIAMTGMGDDEESINRLCVALSDIDLKIRKRKNFDFQPEPVIIPEKVLEVSDAITSKSVQLALSESVGRVSAEYVWAYPPGAPVIVPGEKINESVINQIIGLYSSGISVHSTAKDVPYCIFCVEKPY